MREILGEEEQCPYLGDRRARMRYRLIEACEPRVYQAMLTRGWRRFGRLFFRPACKGCFECRSLRIDVEDFEINRSRRRLLKKNQGVEIYLQRPSVSPAHIELYNRYHAYMTEHKDWPVKATNEYDYSMTFVDGHHEFAHEMLFVEDGRLLIVALVDILPSAVSAVYCFYEPTLRNRGLGVVSILQQISLARQRGIPHLYLGYWVQENASMQYKAQYSPHQILSGRPTLDEPPEWDLAL